MGVRARARARARVRFRARFRVSPRPTLTLTLTLTLTYRRGGLPPVSRGEGGGEGCDGGLLVVMRGGAHPANGESGGEYAGGDAPCWRPAPGKCYLGLG